ncbi:MAG: 3-oxoacyl-[acyl-carrier-protein] synthase III C-terminal domain-containing protein [bacterium]
MCSVYIADVVTRLPKLYSTEESADILYPPHVAGGKANRLAKRAANMIGIKWRPSILDGTCFPKRKIASPEYEPVNWCSSMVKALSESVGVENIGYYGISYNISSDKNVLPSISARVASQTGLVLDEPPEEHPFYGCAGSIFSLKSAFNYCKNNPKLAISSTFDQCSWIVNIVHDMGQSDFKDHLKTSLLFSDGAAGLLLVPENLKMQFKQPLIKIIDIATYFTPGDTIRMENGHLILAENVKDTMPEIVAEKVVKPMLKKHNLTVDDIEEWPLHQGGIPILNRFKEPEILGLSEEKIARSKELFEKYGNFSAPSCLFVLNSFFKEDHSQKAGTKGMMISFGAGCYFGAMLYEWVLND